MLLSLAYLFFPPGDFSGGWEHQDHHFLSSLCSNYILCLPAESFIQVQLMTSQIYFPYLPNCRVRILLEWVEISSNCSLKHCWILRNDAKPRSQVMKTYLGYINIVNDNSSLSGFYCSKDSLYEGRLSAPRPSNNANFLPPRKCAGNTFQNRWKMFNIANLHGEECIQISKLKNISVFILHR